MGDSDAMGAAPAPRHLRLGLVLGLLACAGPFAIDTYLPALPTMARDFGVGIDRVQMSLLSFFIALAAGQLLYGPVSDKWGRKIPLLVGLIVFLAGSVACALARSVGFLIVMRFVQGIGASASITLIRAIVRDVVTGAEAVRLTAMMMLIVGLSPILAPSIGSALLAVFSWRAIFWFITALVTATIVVALIWLPETTATIRPEHRPARSHWALLFSDRQFLFLALSVSFTNAAAAAFVSGSPFLYLNILGFTPGQYGLLFGVNSIALMACVQTNHLMIRRWGLVPFLVGGLIIGAVVMIVAALGTLVAGDRIWFMLPAFFLFYCYLGLVMAPGTVMALHHHGARAGTASALLGAMQFGMSSIVTYAVAHFFDGTSHPMMNAIGWCSALALGCGLASLGFAGKPAHRTAFDRGSRPSQNCP